MEQHYGDEVLSAHLDRDLESATARELERHLAGCPVCRTALEQLMAIRAAAAGLPALEPSAATWFAIRRRTAPRPRFRLPWVWVGIPAAAAAALLVVVMVQGQRAVKAKRFETAQRGKYGADAAAELAAEYGSYIHGINEAIDECEAALAENPSNERVKMAYASAHASRARAMDHMASYGGD